MKKFILLIISILFIFYNKSYAINIENIIAYPVPFNPTKHKIMNIWYKPDATPDPGNNLKITINIYDINGDKVYSQDFSSFITPIIWNGYNNSGKKVKPGLYFIKIKIENTQNGELRRKIIRILIVG